MKDKTPQVIQKPLTPKGKTGAPKMQRVPKVKLPKGTLLKKGKQ